MTLDLIEEQLVPTKEEISDLIKKVWWTKNELCKILLDDPFSVNKKDLLKMYKWLRHLIRFRWIQSQYYDNVMLHQVRLTHMMTRCSKFIYYILEDQFDFSFARDLFYHHDDTEWFSVFWDIPWPYKDQLTKREKFVLDYVENMGIEALLNLFELSSWNDFKEVLKESSEKRRPEWAVMSYLDKAWDWFMQTFHEIVAWNQQYEEPFLNYMKTFRSFKDWKYPVLLKFFEEAKNPKNFRKYILSDFREYPEERDRFFYIYSLFNIDEFLRQENRLDELLTTGKKHTFQSVIRNNYGFKAYWIRKEIYRECREISWVLWHKTTPMLLLTNTVS